MTITYSRPTYGWNGPPGQTPAADRGHGHAEAESEAVRPIDVDAHVDRRFALSAAARSGCRAATCPEQHESSTATTAIAAATSAPGSRIWWRRRKADNAHALDESGVAIETGVEPNTYNPPFCRINATPR
jgi:hypothetical protein